MAILWCGGEDIDFPNGTAAFGIQTGVGTFRTGYARCAISASAVNTFARSNSFPGGPITSCWFTARWNNFTATLSVLHMGLVKDLTTNAGLWLGTGTATASKLTLYTYDGTTKTVLAAESGTTISGSGTQRKVDIQLVNYGSSATVNVYVDYNLLITFTGNVTVSGVTSLSAVGLGGVGGNVNMSEFIVSDVDTRPLIGLQTLALTGAGTTNNWTGNTFSNINGTTLSDVNPASSNANAQVQDYNITDLIAGTYAIQAVKISARMALSTTPAVTKVNLGYNNGSGSSGSGTGATKTIAATGTYTTYEQLDSTNPITSAGWVQADINPLQLELTALT